jgi:alkylation response protein AidB-like acyl-CoA dehydrogenase
MSFLSSGNSPSLLTQDTWASAVEAVAGGPVREAASHVDSSGSFPQQSLQALAEAGFFGLISAAEVGGAGLGLAEASAVVRRLAQECGSTAMIVCMHYCGTAVLEAHGTLEVRQTVARGAHLSTLAFSEAGSRSHFWAPLSTAHSQGEQVLLNAHKSWITSAGHAHSYVWSSRATDAAEGITLWLVPRDSMGLKSPGPFEGLGLRGNDSCPVTAENVAVPLGNRLGGEGEGFGIMMGTVLPTFQVLNASCSLGLMEGAVRAAVAHASNTRLIHLGQTLRDIATTRAYLARMQVKTDMVATLLGDTIAALGAGRADAMLRVLEVKAAAGETATEVLDLAMRVCGGAAFRKEVGVERLFRDGRAATVMAPTTDALYDFIGKAITNLELFG